MQGAGTEVAMVAAMPCARTHIRLAAAGAGGFSLVEVLVASGLLASAIAGLAHLAVVAARANLHARDTTYATVLAAQKIEELRAAPFPAPAVAESTEDLDGRGGLIAGGGPAGPATYQRRWTIEPLPGRPLDAVVIAVAVTRYGAATGEVRLATIRTRKGL